MTPAPVDWFFSIFFIMFLSWLTGREGQPPMIFISATCRESNRPSVLYNYSAITAITHCVRNVSATWRLLYQKRMCDVLMGGKTLKGSQSNVPVNISKKKFFFLSLVCHLCDINSRTTLYKNPISIYRVPPCVYLHLNGNVTPIFFYFYRMPCFVHQCAQPSNLT